MEIRIPENDAYDWLNGLGDCESPVYPDASVNLVTTSGKYMKVKCQYTDSITNERVFIVDWYCMRAQTYEDAINFAKQDTTNHYWGLRKKHRNDEDGIPVIGFRR